MFIMHDDTTIYEFPMNRAKFTKEFPQFSGITVDQYKELRGKSIEQVLEESTSGPIAAFSSEFYNFLQENVEEVEEVKKIIAKGPEKVATFGDLADAFDDESLELVTLEHLVGLIPVKAEYFHGTSRPLIDHLIAAYHAKVQSEVGS